MKKALQNVSIVLVEPQDDINIGTAVRAAKNFGITSMRLVRPASADPHTILVSAPGAQDMVENLEILESVDEALADSVLTLGMTARSRSARWQVFEPPGAAKAVIRATAQGRVALVFGREDSGLPNEVLDRCHGIITVPTNPDYSSLNLGQAVLLMAWELFRQGLEKEEAAESTIVAESRSGSDVDLAPMEGLERMFRQAEDALSAIEFFKAGTSEHIMRSLRSVFLRARLDRRELAIWHGIFKEVVAYMKRTERI